MRLTFAASGARSVDNGTRGFHRPSQTQNVTFKSTGGRGCYRLATLVSERTIEAPSIPGLAHRDRGVRTRTSPFALVREHPVFSTGIGLVLLSIALIKFANTRPGYDPYGWLVWGHQTLHLNLNLGGAPSWKPLPFVFTVPYALFGRAELWLWFVTAVAVSLSGVVFAGRIAYRLTGASPGRRYAPIAAAIFAGAALFGIRDYMHYILSAQSDPMIVALCLGAIDSFMSKRYRLAFGLLVLGALGRPEVWPFLGLLIVWAWLKQPEMRRLIIAGVLAIAFLWFGVPVLSGQSPFVAGNLALNSPRALHQNQISGTLDRFFDLHELIVQLLALLTIAIAAVRRERFTLIIAGCAAGWVVVEIAFALHGWPALPRYIFEPAAVMVVLAGVAVGKLLAMPERLRDLPGSLARVADRLPRFPVWAPIVVVAALSGALVPAAVSRVRDERKDLHHERARTRQINRLGPLVARLGGASHILYCGTPATEVAFQSIVAWTFNMNVGPVDYMPHLRQRHYKPIVLFEPALHGWAVRPSHTLLSKVPACRGLRAKTRLR